MIDSIMQVLPVIPALAIGVAVVVFFLKRTGNKPIPAHPNRSTTLKQETNRESL